MYLIRIRIFRQYSFLSIPLFAYLSYILWIKFPKCSVDGNCLATSNANGIVWEMWIFRTLLCNSTTTGILTIYKYIYVYVFQRII